MGFANRSAARRGIFVESKIKQRFKLRLVAVRQHRNRPPRRGWGMGWRGWLQRFRSGRSGEPARGLREFLEGEARYLGDDVINARLEARRGFARDVVLEFVEQENLTSMNQFRVWLDVNHNLNRTILSFVATGLIALLSGCGTIDQSRFKTFSESSQSIAASTKDAYDLLNQVEAEKKREKLIASSLPPYKPENRALLEGSLHLPKSAIDERLKVTAGLEAYAKSLQALAAGPDLSKWDSSVDSVATALQDFKTHNASNFFSGFAAQMPSENQVKAFSGAVQTIGHLILELKTKKALKKVIQQAAPAIDEATKQLAADMGDSNPTNHTPVDGVRAYFYRTIYEKQLVELSSSEKWKIESDRPKIVDDSLALVEKRRQVDEMLDTLRETYLKFGQAHHELEQVVSKSEKFDWKNAISTLSQLGQRLNEITKALKEQNK